MKNITIVKVFMSKYPIVKMSMSASKSKDNNYMISHVDYKVAIAIMAITMPAIAVKGLTAFSEWLEE